MTEFPPGVNPLTYLNDPAIKNRKIAYPPTAPIQVISPTLELTEPAQSIMNPPLLDDAELYYPARSMTKFPPGVNPLKYLNDPAIKNRQITFQSKAAHEKEKENAAADQKAATDREIDDDQKATADKNAAHEKEKETVAVDEKTNDDQQADEDKKAGSSSPSTDEVPIDEPRKP